MLVRIVWFAILAAAPIACARQTQIDVAPVQRQAASEPASLVFPTLDSATLASLHALLGQLQAQNAELHLRAIPGPEMYALFRDLEEVQRRFSAEVWASDSTKRSLYDQLAALMTRTDSLFPRLERAESLRLRP